MLFTRNKELNKRQVDLISSCMEKFIGQTVGKCRDIAAGCDFILLDQWDEKLGFVKEKGNENIVLSLHFKDGFCNFYQVILKKANEKWKESQFISSDIVRTKGLI